MIKSIFVKDFALIDELELFPGPGLNIITGQTGAGKSIIIGAFNMILGERADTDTIRHGASKAIAEAEIQVGENPVVKALLKEAEIEFSGSLLLRREIRDSGSRAFINDTPVPVSVLRQVGDLLVDLHGQHDHQLLLKEENHQGVIDGLPEVRPVWEAYREVYRENNTLRKELNQLKKKEKELQEKQDLYRFQLKELESVQLDTDDISSMETEMKLLDNAEELDQKAGVLAHLGGEGEVNIDDLLSTMEDALKDLSAIESGFDSYLQEFKAARISIHETIRFAERYRSGIEFNPQRLEFLRNKQAELRKLEKKYSRSIPELISYKEQLQHDLNLADNYDVETRKLQERVEASTLRLAEAAQKLHDARIQASLSLGRAIEDELKKLGIPYAKFETRVNWMSDPGGWITRDGENVTCTDSGADEVLFYISTNKGEIPKPLSKTASGGEISRVMLALKSILARQQSLPVMIFDEIDTGISGAVAEQVGRTMRELSQHCQIIAITHQPQIASQAHLHFKVYKQEDENRTTTSIVPLPHDKHIYEVATLMSGSQVTESALRSARELVDSAFDR